MLADYVLALIRSDAPDEEIRKASVENLEDFLKESQFTSHFLDDELDVLQASIHVRIIIDCLPVCGFV